MNKRGTSSQSLKKQLQIIIDNIERQFIILNKVEFNRYSDLAEVRPKKIEAKHTLKIGVGFSEAQSGESNDKYFAFIINYTHEEELYSAENGEEENIAHMKIKYMLNLTLKPSEEVKSVLSNEIGLFRQSRIYSTSSSIISIPACFKASFILSS